LLLLFAVGPLAFSLQEKKQADRAASREGPVLRITWNSDGMILASTPSNQTVKPLDGAVGKPRTTLEGYTGDVYTIAWSPNGKILATGSDDRTIKLWDAATGKLLANLPAKTASES
jgi:WD40 repeat protein